MQLRAAISSNLYHVYSSRWLISNFNCRIPVFILLLSALLVGCGPVEDDPYDYSGDSYYEPDSYPDEELEELPPPPNIAGVWSGTWEGIDASFGPATGTWVARISQRGSDVDGPIAFGGDIDCADGQMSGFADAQSQQISGQVFRNPCPFNDWLFSAFDQQEYIASGSWQKQGLSNGSFEGRRIATFTGPEISHVFPPAAKAGDLVTLVGKRLAVVGTTAELRFGANGTLITPDEVTDQVVRIRLPLTTESSAQFVLSGTDGLAISPRVFNTAVSSPNRGYTRHIALAPDNVSPAGIAASVNGRRVYVANRGNGTVSMINTEIGQEWISETVFPGPSPAIPVHAIAVDPDGRRIYVAGEGMLAVMHAHTLEVIRTLLLPSSAGDSTGHRGIAISPDGRWLLIANAKAGGSVTILDLENNFDMRNFLQMSAGNLPKGIAVNPDNLRAYIAQQGDTNEILVYNLLNQSLEAPLEIGRSPDAISVSADGRQIYLVNQVTGTLNSFDLETGVAHERQINIVNHEFAYDLGISPDSRHLYVSTQNGIYVFDTENPVNQQTPAFLPLGIGTGFPLAITFTPNGKRAYVTLPGANKVIEIGSQRTLRISKQGGGIGTVNSSSGDINCGASCISSFDSGAQVNLSTSVNPYGNSVFHRWEGDSDCYDGRVTMNSNVFCVAVFEYEPPPSNGGGSSGSGSGSSSDDYGSSSCFIATAAYGSWLDPHVLTLRQFRDEHLLTNVAGTWLVGFYYRHSPPVAAYIREHEAVRVMVRFGLAPVVYTIKYPLLAGLFLLLAILVVMRRRKRLLIHSNRNVAACYRTSS